VAQFVVRNIEDDVAEKRRRRAKQHARSMEDEVRHILRAAVQEPSRSAVFETRFGLALLPKTAGSGEDSRRRSIAC
jgi:plasmid stability protein